MSERATMTIMQAAKLLGISRNGAYNAANSGAIPTIRIGRTILVPVAAIERMLGQHQIEPIKQPPRPPRKITISISLTDDLHNKLVDDAEANKVSLKDVIIKRINRSFEQG